MKTSTPPGTVAARPPGVKWRGTRFAGAVLGLATLAVYANSFSGPLIFDDVGSILENPTIRHLWPIADVLSPPSAYGVTVGGRPLLNLSLALNYAVSGTAVWSYHLLNILIHVLAGLTLFGIVRRTLRFPFGPAASDSKTADPETTENLLVALTVAALWTLHPLQTESVTYVIQRAESLMGLLYLQTLYAFIRAVEAPRSRAWPVWCVAACLLGMATKEVMVSAPIMVLLYDRTFGAGTFRDAWRLRGRLYCGLACTWILLGVLVAGTGGNRGGSIGLGLNLGWWDHTLTQFRAVSRYLWLSFWPHPLVFDYGPEKVVGLWDVIPYALLVGALILVTVLGFLRRTALGFAGVCFFAILAPTSLIPGPIQMTVEHRMYLPLAVVMAAVVIFAHRLFGRRAVFAGLGVAVAFAILTVARNNDYRTELAIWERTVEERPENPVALSAYARLLYESGKAEEAVAYDERALRVNPWYDVTLNNLGLALMKLGQGPEAIDAFNRSIQAEPNRDYVHANLARALVQLGRGEEAVGQFQEALRQRPDAAEVHSQLGSLLMKLNRAAEAADHFAASLRYRPNNADTEFNLGNALVVSGHLEEAVPHFEKAVLLHPSDTEAACNLAEVLVDLKRPADAVARFEGALKIEPNNASIHARFGVALGEMGRSQDAIDQATRAVQLQPQDPGIRLMLAEVLAQGGQSAAASQQYGNLLQSTRDPAVAVQAHNGLGLVYLQQGDRVRAATEFESALRIDPAFAPAASNLARLRSTQ